MFANLFSRIGLTTSAEQRSAEDGLDDEAGESNTTPPHFSAVGANVRSQNFSEHEFMDSGLASSELPYSNLDLSELNALEFDEAFLEEYILAKLQDVQRRLHIVRELKTSIADELAGRTSPSNSTPKRRASERIFVASHRLPVSISADAAGNIATSKFTGRLGLMSAFRDLLETIPMCWVGGTGQSSMGFGISDELGQANVKRHFLKPVASKSSLALLRYVPVFLSAEDEAAHQSFCSSILWPLFHYMPLSFEGERSFLVTEFERYRRVNEIYAHLLLREWADSGIAEADAMFWIHDFHFLLVPRMLRNRLPNSRIGFFLHTPFPSGEVFRTCPVRKELLDGVLGADLVGFHTYDYARHFLSVCERILGLHVRPNGVDDKGLFVRVGIYPFGIDTDVFKATMRKTSVLKRVDELRSDLRDRKIILGIDRLDYIKGIPHKMLAMEHFLENHPEWIGKVVLLQVCAPSMSKSEQYKTFRSEILEMVGRINGRFATLDGMPIHYRETFLKLDELCALYAAADVAVMTSLRDGMNLASYEYIMCQGARKATLVLSEFTGAAQNLPGAILCNPWDMNEVSDGIYRALTMPDFERELKYSKLERYVAKHTAAAWGVNFIDDLAHHAAERKKAREKLVRLRPSDVTMAYKEADRLRLFLLDYDGTLRHYESQPELAEPSERVLKLLERLTEDPRNCVFIVTGRQKVTMEEWLSGFGLGFAVEHGFSLQWPSHFRARFGRGEELWEDLLSAEDCVVMQNTLRLVGESLEQFEDYTPTSFVETKESAYSWHFRDADPDFANSRALDARSALEQIVAGSPMEVLMGQKILYVRPRGVNKGAAVQEIVRRLCDRGERPEWILSVGDDRTDEDMFKALDSVAKDVAITCTVGRKTTAAQFYVNDVEEVIELLEMLERLGA